MALRDPTPVSPANDFAVLVGPVSALDPATGLPVAYAEPSIDSWFATSKDSDTPIASVTVSALLVTGGAAGTYVPTFDGAEMTTILAGLAEDTEIYCIVRGPDFRGYVRCIVKRARQLV